MKIVLLTTFYKPSVGGVERQVEEIFLNLRRRGLNVKVFTTDASHSNKDRLEMPQNEEGVFRFKYLFGFGYFFRFSLGLTFRLLTEDYDILHVHNSHDAHLVPAILITLFRQKKLVLTGHNPYVVNDKKRGTSLSFFVQVFDKVISLFSFRINRYIALLDSEKDFVKNYLDLKETQVTIIPNGIRNDYFEQVYPLDEENIFYSKYKVDRSKYSLVLGCLCRMDYVKGIQNLEQSVKDNPDCLFIFAGGDGGYLDALEEIFKNCSNVLFTKEYINVDDSIQFYSFIDIFLLPSVYEPFGITLVEAMTQGKYVLASSVGGPSEIIKKTYGEILDPFNQELWSQKIKEIKNNKSNYIEMGKNGVDDSKKYKWENVINEIIEVYKSA